MERLRKLIKEVLSTPPKKDECNCGCHTCENVGNPGVLINESLNRKVILSENLQYHVDNQLPLTENTFRYGSEAFLNLWSEARYLYVREIIHVNEDDKSILEETNLGEYGMYEGVKVALDLPMVYENQYEPILEDIQIYGEIYESVNIENSYQIEDIESDEVSNSFIFTDKHGVKRKLQFFKGDSVKLLWFDPKSQEWTTERIPSKYEDEKVMNTFGMILVKVILPKYGSFHFKALSEARYRLFRALIYNSLDTSKYEMDYDDEARTIEVHQIENLTEENLDESTAVTAAASAAMIAARGINSDGSGGESNPWALLTVGVLMALPFAGLAIAQSGLGKKVMNWLEKYKLNRVIDRLRKDPEVLEFIKSKKPGIQNFLKSKLTDKEQKYIKQISWNKITKGEIHEINNFIDEAEGKKKTPPIGKPKRGGSKKFYVYVRDKGKVKKVSFGDTTGLSAKINNPEARRAFAARHDCKNKKDKTKASYWSCRLPRFAKLLGLKGSFSGFW